MTRRIVPCVLVFLVYNMLKATRAFWRQPTPAAAGRRVCRFGALSSSSRISSEGISLDTNVVSTNPALVLSHLKSRRSSDVILGHVATISSLRSERNALIVEGDAAKGARKTLSQLIGQSMKEGKEAQVLELKRQVEEASVKSAAADDELAKIDADINAIFSIMPNLLDDR